MEFVFEYLSEIATAAIGLSFIFVYLYKICEVPHVICGNQKLLENLSIHCPTIKKVVYPPPWCLNGAAQTIVRSVFGKKRQVEYQREIFNFEDGGQCALDWSYPSNLNELSANSPVFIILHGITGNSRESYVMNLAYHLLLQGHIVVAFNYRGQGNVPLKTPKSYCAAYTDDIHAVSLHVKAKYPTSPILAAGFSLGGMILYNYVAAKGANCPLAAGMVISAAWNVWVSTESLESFPYRQLFNTRLASYLSQKLQSYRKLFEKTLDFNEIQESRTIRDFDKHAVVPMFGYRDIDDYYKAATIENKIHLVKIPMLCIAAADDPFAPGYSLPLEEIRKSDSTCMLLYKRGGHLAFLNGLWPFASNLVETLAGEFVNCVYRQDNIAK